jgi:hypothetical protein
MKVSSIARHFNVIVIYVFIFLLFTILILDRTSCSKEGKSNKYIILNTQLPPDERPIYKLRCVPDKIDEQRLDSVNKVPYLLVPNTVTNLAKSKPVTASDSDPIVGRLELVTDGNKRSVEGCYVEFPPGTRQWIQVDLQSNAMIYAVWVWHFYEAWKPGWDSCYKDVIVDIFDTTNANQKVVTIFNNDYDNSAGKGFGKDLPYLETKRGKLIPVIPPVHGRYIRLYSNGNCDRNCFHGYVEVEVFGVYD